MLVLLAGWCGLIARSALRLKAEVELLQTDLDGAAGGRFDAGVTHAHIAALRDDLIQMRSFIAPVLLVAPHLGWLPEIGYEVQSAPTLLEGAIDLATAGEVVLSAIGPEWPPRGVEGQPAWLAVAYESARLAPQLAPARVAIDRAAQRLDQIDARRLTPALGSPLARVASALPLLQAGLDLIDVAPELLGLNRPRTYLVLMQNDDELRPTGGFISAVARLTLDRGQIIDLQVRDSYTVDDYAHKPYGEPPEPLLEFMGLELWLFRDANWSPDFPTSARKAAELYRYGTGVAVDGVIGLNQQAVQNLVGGLGPLEVEPGQPPVVAANVIDYMRSAWAPPADSADFQAWLVSRKDFIEKLMEAVLDRLQAAPDRVNWMELGQALIHSLATRDVLIWIDDSAVSEVLGAHNWDGAVRQTPGDYWMLVDANLGYNKANAVVDSSVTYTVTLQPDGSADADLAIRYRHTAPSARGCVHYSPYSLESTYQSLMQACYYNYLRVLTPAGAFLAQASSQSVPAEYLVTARAFDGSTRTSAGWGKTVFETFFVMERGQGLEVTLSYHIPAVVAWTADGGEYSLIVQKQSGARPRPAHIILRWPVGYVLASTNQAPISADTRAASFALHLSSDQTLSVTWSRE